jgi:serine/threonine protein kinase/Tol biopolymer transport system component
MALISLYCAACGMANHPQSRLCARCATALPVLSSHLPVDVSERQMRTRTGAIGANVLLKQRYLILERLGRGGMGAVYKAADIELGNALRAVKEMNMVYLNQEDINDFSEAFKHEALLLATLQHHHLPRIYDHFYEQGRWYLVMDYIDGFNLGEYLRLKGGVLPLLETLGIGMQLCTVLDYLHTHEPPIIFRDLKPANVMRAKDGHLYLIDFGIARIFKNGQTRDTSVFVSYGYAAPEQYGLVQTTPQADIYSLGSTLHQMITGADPGKMPLPWAFAPLRLSRAVSATGLGNLIMHMLDVNPMQRPTSAARVKQELQRIAMGRSPTGSPVTSSLSTGNTNTRHTTALQTSQHTSALQASQALQHAGLTQAQKAPQYSNSSQALQTQQYAGSSQALQRPITQQALRNQPPLGTVLAQHTGHISHILGLAWSPDGRRIVSAGSDQKAHVWHAGSGHTLLAYQKHSFVIQAVAWSPEGQYIASAGDDHTVQVWDASTGELALLYQGHTGYVTMLAWAPDGTALASGGSDQTIQIWQPTNGRRRLTYRGHTGPLSALAWSPDSMTMLSISRYQERNKHGDPIHKTAIAAWSTSTGENLGATTPEALTTGTLATVAWSPNGKHVALGGNDCYVHIYRWERGLKNEVFCFKDHTKHLRALDWSPDGKRIASVSDDSCVLVWDALTGANVDIYRGKAVIYTIAWSPDSQRLAASLDGKTVQVWQAE